MPPPLDDAKHWRARAAQMCVLADEMNDAAAARIMGKLANDYYKLADQDEERANKFDLNFPSPLGHQKSNTSAAD